MTASAGGHRLLGLVGIALLLLAACGPQAAANSDAASSSPSGAAQTVEVARASTVVLRPVVVGSGSVAAVQELVISAEAGGLRILEVLVEEGAAVKRGQLLLRLNDAILRAQIGQNTAQLNDAEIVLESARTELRRAEGLVLGQAITEATLAQRRTTASSAETRVSQVSAQRDELLARLAQTEVRAPADGIISKRSALLGAVPGAGAELFRLIRDGALELNALVPELDIDKVAAGQPATVVHGDRVLSAAVRAIAPTVDPATRLGTVRIGLPVGSGLLPGMFARAEFTVDERTALAVPTSSIVFADGRPGVFVLGESGKASFRPIRTGVQQGGRTEVLTGISKDAIVVTTGAAFLTDGDLVRVSPARAAD